jgi:hypothetical protein
MKKCIGSLFILGLMAILYGEAKPIISPTYLPLNLAPETEIFPKQSEVSIESGWAQIAPVLDGIISAGEWRDATLLDISCNASAPVYLLIMNDNNYLYLAILDANLNNYDSPEEVGVYFDENKNGIWDENGGEGNFWFGTPSGAFTSPGPGIFRPILSNCFGSPPYTSTGTYHSSGITGNYISFEIKIGLNSSPLNALPGDTIGMWIYYFDFEDFKFYGDLNCIYLQNLWCDPGSYPGIALSPGPTSTVEGNKISKFLCKVFPNPSSGKVNFLISGESGTSFSIEIFDVSGRKVNSIQGKFLNFLSTITLDLNKGGWSPEDGVYFYRVEAGESEISGKIVVKK